MRILGIDPGVKNIGIAISDPTKTLAAPFTIITHKSRMIDAASIVAIATENQAELIVIGQALDQDGKPTVSGRSSARLAAAIRKQIEIPVIFWDESYSTKEAQSAREKIVGRKQTEHMDDLAASIILQSYLDAQSSK